MRRALLLAVALPLLGGGVAEGNRAYRAGDARRAAAVYARALAAGDSSAVVRYNLGTALLRMERWDDARPHLEAAAALPVRRELAVRAHYNAGNADLLPVYRRTAEEEERVERLRRAIGRYRRALRLDPSDLDAKWNLEIAQKLLRREEESGGGGAPEDEGGGGGDDGAQNEQPRPAPGPPQPSPQGQGTDSPRLSRAEAERILSGAARRERETQEEVLGRNRGQPRPARDW